MCRSIKICHNSKGAAWTTVQVFSALEPLLTKLRLEPATESVEVKPLQGCLSSGCCCSTPVELRFSLPVHDKTAAALELAAVTEFLQFRLPRELQGTACTSGLTSCPPAKASQHKVIRWVAGGCAVGQAVCGWGVVLDVIGVAPGIQGGTEVKNRWGLCFVRRVSMKDGHDIWGRKRGSAMGHLMAAGSSSLFQPACVSGAEHCIGQHQKQATAADEQHHHHGT